MARVKDANAWTAILSPPVKSSNAASRADRLGLALAQLDALSPLPAELSWLARGMRTYLAAQEAGERLTIERALGVEPRASRAYTLHLRNEEIRELASTVPAASQWERAELLTAVIHSTGVMPTAELQSAAEDLRKRYQGEIPRTTRQLYAILTSSASLK